MYTIIGIYFLSVSIASFYARHIELTRRREHDRISVQYAVLVLSKIIVPGLNLIFAVRGMHIFLMKMCTVVTKWLTTAIRRICL